MRQTKPKREPPAVLFVLLAAACLVGMESLRERRPPRAEYETAAPSVQPGVLDRLLATQRCSLLAVGEVDGRQALAALALGCSAVVVDTQPHCVVLFDEAARESGFTAYEARWAAVSAPGAEPLAVSATGCPAPAGGERVFAPALELGDIVADSDYTPTVLRVSGALAAETLRQAVPLLLETRLVSDVFMAVRGDDMAGLSAALESAMRAGYRLTAAGGADVTAGSLLSLLKLAPGEWWAQRV